MDELSHCVLDSLVRFVPFLLIDISFGVLDMFEYFRAHVGSLCSFLVELLSALHIHSSSDEDEVVVLHLGHRLLSDDIFNEDTHDLAVDRFDSLFLVHDVLRISLQDVFHC